MSAPPIGNMSAVPAKLQQLMNENIYSLPRLPVPALEDTLARYLASVKPFCTTPDEYAAQEALVEEFKSGTGAQLHADLVKADGDHEGYPHSFIEKHWDAMYYGLRCPAPVNISPFFALEDDKDAAKMTQTARAAAFVSGFTKWTRMVLAGDLSQDKDMCSNTFPKHFSSAKIPKKGMDELMMYSESRHIAVLCNGHLYTLEVISADGTLLEQAGIAAKLDEIVVAANSKPSAGLAVLTAEDRDVWAGVRASLEALPGNAEKLKAIDAGIIMVCLDPAPKDKADYKEKGMRLLVGDGAQRWWDKQQLVVDGSGFMGIAFEHSYGDGTNWGRFIKESMDDAAGKPGALPQLPTHPASAGAAPEEVELATNAEITAAVAAAAVNYSKLQAEMQLEFLNFDTFGKNEIKTWNCSPDAVLQLAFMAAYYALHGAMPPVYEACATRKFFHGRTETIRSATEAATAFCKALASGAPKEETQALMQAAAKAHAGVSKAAATGSGIDRHLTAMANNGTAAGVKLPALYSDAKFQHSKNWHLSTSNGTGPYLSMFGFAAVITEGYGLGYLINNDNVSVVVSCWASYSETDSVKMRDAISATLMSMQKVAK